MRKLALAIVLAAAAIIAALWLWPREGADATLEAAAGGRASTPGARGTGRSGETAQGGRAGAGESEAERSWDDPLADGGPHSVLEEEQSTAADGILEVTVTAGVKPVSRAVVHLYRQGLRDPNTNAIDWRAAGTTATQEEGVARLPARPGSYLVSARAEGFAPLSREVLRPSGERVTRVQLALDRGSSLSGRTVTKGKREPVPLADLTLTFEGAAAAALWKRVDAPSEERVAAVSDPRGTFRVDGLAAGAWRVEARAVGFGKAVQRGVAVPRAGELVIEMAAAGNIEGFVVTSEGSPAGGAMVSVSGGEDEVVVQAGQGGGFSAEVGQGLFTLSARRGAETGAVAEPVAVAAGAAVRGVTIRLGASCALEGTVVARSSQAPIAGASVDVSPYKRTGDSGRTVTDETGAYSVAGLPPGAYDVVVTATGFSQLERRGVTVTAGQRFPLKLELEGTGAIDGTVKDDRGSPIAGAVVRAGSRWPGGSGPTLPEARTDEAGLFRLVQVPLGKVNVQARREEAASGAGKLVDVVEGQTATADLVLTENGVVTGTVTLKSKAPLTEPASVHAGTRRRDRMSGPENADVRVEPGGAYRLVLPAGRWNLIAVGDKPNRSYSGNTVAAEVEAGKTLQLDLVLSDESVGGVSGVVLEPGGAPSPSAFVALSAAGANGAGAHGGTSLVSTDDEGRFQFPAEPWMTGAPLKVRARNGGRSSEWANTAANASDLALALRPAATLAGKVVSSGGEPVTSFTVWTTVLEPDVARFYFRGEERLEFATDRFEIPDAPAEHLKVTARTADGRNGSAETTLAPGGRGEVTVTLEPGASLTGVVLAAVSKAPLAEAFVSVDGKAPELNHGAVGADGRFKVTDLAPGDHSLRASAPQYRSSTRTVTLAAGQALDLGEFVLTKQGAPPGSIGVGFGMNGGQVLITGLLVEGPGERAGLREGDAVVTLDAVAVTTVAEASKRARGVPGTTVSVVVRRGADTKSFQVTRAN